MHSARPIACAIWQSVPLALFSLCGALLPTLAHSKKEVTASTIEPKKASRWSFDTSIYAIYDTQSFKGSVFTEEDITDSSINYLRRVKASGSIAYDKVSLDIALDYHDQDKKTQLDELSLNYRINKHIQFTAGKFKEPLGLENQLSLKHQPLLERSVPTNAMLFGRNTGIAFDINHKGWTLDLAMMYQKADTNTYRDSLAHVTRMTFAPIKEKNTFMHIGFDFSSRRGTEDVYDINEPLLAAGVGNLVHSPNFNADEIKLSGLELAYGYKSLLFQSEFFQQRIKQTAIADQTLYGYYATMVWTILGDSRLYKNGKLKFPGKAKHTVELATRFSSTTQTPVFKGDDAQVSSVALNYFFRKHVRASVEYQNADLTSNGKKKTKELEGQSVNLRLQLSY